MRGTVIFFLMISITQLRSVEYIPPRYELYLYPSGSSDSFSLGITVKCFVDSSPTRVFIRIPEGVEILSGNNEEVVDLDSGNVYENILVLKFPSNGKYVISAKVNYLGSGMMYRDMTIRYLYVFATDTSFTYGFSAPSGFYDTFGDSITDTTLTYLQGSNHVVVSGSVSYYDEDLESRLPFPHARIYMKRETPSPALVASTWTDSSGNYTIDVYVPSGTYTIFGNQCQSQPSH